MSKHAVLSASAAARWLKCPPSARLNAAEPDTVSEYAAEGTRAHAAAEECLRAYLEGRESNATYDDGEMKEAVARYVDICVEKIVAAKKATPDTVAKVEERLDFSSIVPDGFGTGDMVIISDDTIEIIDLKYGKGVPVSAVHNPQMRLYALGACSAYDFLYGFSKVRMTIVQPRLDSVSTDELSIRDLMKWAKEIKKTAELAYKGKGTFCAGDHCRFCKVKARCKALSEYELAEVNKYFPDEAWELEPETIADIILKSTAIDNWIKAVKEYALTEALNGREWPNLKLVAGRSKRIITNDETAADILLKEGYKTDDIYKPKELITLTALDKLVGKKRLAEILDPVLSKQDGKPTLVSEEDKRPKLDILDDFDDSILE